MFDWSARWAMYSPSTIALKEYETGKTLTYSQLNTLAHRAAHVLEEVYGVKPGDRVAVFAENNLLYPILFCAAQKVGFVLVPLNYRLAVPELEYLLTDSEPQSIVIQEDMQPKLAASVVYQGVPHRLSLEALLAELDAASQYDGKPLSHKVTDPHTPIFILYTSGTTGFPKGALYTHHMLLWNSINTQLRLDLNSQDRTIMCMPPFHTGGWNVLLTPLMHHGAYTCLMKKFDAHTVLQALEDEACTIFMGVPTMLKMMADDVAFDQVELKPLRYFIVGGEAMPVPLIERWQNKGVPIRQGYGMTEVGPNLTSLHQDDTIRKIGSIGKPNFYLETRIVDEHGHDVPQGQPGELWIRSEVVTPGYWRNEAATQSSITPEGWFRTGDMLREDEEGFLYVVDRIKNMYISGGENVYPAEIEKVLLRHPAVAEAVVLPVPDPKWGEAGLAVVVLKPGETADSETLRAHCSAHLARFKVPRDYHFQAALPKNDAGKIDRKALKSSL